MDSVPLNIDADRREFNELASLFDAPAYIRRARGVEMALEHLVATSRPVREEYLEMPRLRVGQLQALAGEWSALVPWLADGEQIAVLERLHALLAPRLRLPPERTTSARALRRSLGEVVASVERFNARWGEHLDRIDVAVVNELRDGYNRYYVLEKACALRSDLLARRGFEPIAPLDRAELERHLPLLPVPRLAESQGAR